MVAEGDLGGAGVDHPPHDVDGFELLWAPVDQVADEDCLAIGVSPRPGADGVAHLAQQGGEDVGVPVHISDHVVAGRPRVRHGGGEDGAPRVS